MNIIIPMFLNGQVSSIKKRDNVFLVNNISVQQNDVRLIFSTLWSKISPVNEWQIERNISEA